MTCEARDIAGNTNAASFYVHVLTSAEQLENLTRAVEISDIDAGLQSSLLAMLGNGLRDVRPSGACGSLRAFTNEVRAQSGRRIRSDLADGLIEMAANMRTLLGCR